MTNKAQKIVIFGGSFDPPHYGHFDIVKNLERSFDKVIVVPSYISPFKSGDKTDEGNDVAVRFKLCKKLFTSDKTEVSRREIAKKGVSYSVDTAAYFAKKYKDAKLYWAIGTEELLRLPEWHDIDRLKALVEFVAIPRPGYPADAELLSSLKKLKIKVKHAKFVGLDISSTQIKIDKAFGKTDKYVPSVVAAEAEKSGAFDPYSKYVDALYEKGLSDKRIEHTYGVAVKCAELAKLYGANVRDCVIAGILHDIAKEVDVRDYAGKVDAVGFPAPTVHAAIGAYIAKRDFGVSDEIANAIRTHATASDDMSLVGEILYLADKTEEGRNYKEVYAFRHVCSVDKDLAMYRILTEVTEWRDREQQNTPCEMTSRAIEHYKKLAEGKTVPEMPKRSPRCEVKQASLSLPAVRTTSALGKKATASRELRVTEKRSSALRSVEEHSKAVVKQEDTEELIESTSENISKVVAAELSLHKAHDIIIVDLDGKTIIADYFVIASCSSSTAVKALSDYVEDKLTKKFGIDPSRRDIDREWAALDYGGVIVHIFTDKTREFYNLERLWSDGKNVRRFDD